MPYKFVYLPQSSITSESFADHIAPAVTPLYQSSMNFEQLSLAACILVATLLWVNCVLPPNPAAEIEAGNKVKDHLHIPIIGLANVRYTVWIAHTILATIYGILIYTYPMAPKSICPQPSFARLSDPTMFTWNTKMVLVLATIAGSAAIRIMAFRNLGVNFTFNLKRPSGLVKTGIHGYIQHPSYTGVIPMIICILFIYIRFDGVAACYLSAPWVESLVKLQPLLMAAVVLILTVGGSTRVADEEKMLKQAFGKEWEEYHRTTKRFIPGVI